MLDGPMPGREDYVSEAQLEVEGDAFMGMMAVNQQVAGR